MHSRRRKAFCAILVLVTLFLPSALSAAPVTNTAVGGVRGLNNGTLIGGDGTGRAQFTLNVVDLVLVKQARNLRGGVLEPGAPVDAGSELFFLLYVANPSEVASSEIQITDLLDVGGFDYVPNSLEMTTVPGGATDGEIWMGPWTPLSDEVGQPDDAASITDLDSSSPMKRITIGSTDEQTNQSVTLPKSSLVAIRFRVRVN